MKVPRDLIKAVYENRSIRENVGQIVYSAPKSCQEPSSIPGYIKVTSANKDQDGNLVDINTQFIVAVEPYLFDGKEGRKETYQTVSGSTIICATNCGDGIHYSYIVYESCNIVRDKIIQSLESLSSQVGGIAGLLDVLETLLADKIQN